MIPDTLAASAEERSRFFWWLAEWFLAPPDPERLASLPDTSDGWTPADLPDGLGRAWQALAVSAPAPGSTPPLEHLGVEFTRLFSGLQEGLGPPPPFESVWREERLIGETTAQVIATYSRAGFADIEPATGPQDHVAVELKFLALLAFREAEAWLRNDREAAVLRGKQQQDFIAEHVNVWVPRWARAVAEQARHPLYPALVRLLVVGLEQSLFECSGDQANDVLPPAQAVAR